MRIVEAVAFSFDKVDLLAVYSVDEEAGDSITLMRWDAQKTSLQFEVGGDILPAFTDVLLAIKPKGSPKVHSWPTEEPRLFIDKGKGVIAIKLWDEDLNTLELATFTKDDHANGRVAALAGWMKNCREALHCDR